MMAMTSPGEVPAAAPPALAPAPSSSVFVCQSAGCNGTAAVSAGCSGGGFRAGVGASCGGNSFGVLPAAGCNGGTAFVAPAAAGSCGGNQAFGPEVGSRSGSFGFLGFRDRRAARQEVRAARRAGSSCGG
jgi:hypothetical protein